MRLCQSCSGRYCLTLLVSALFAMALGMTLPTTAWASDGEEEPTGFLAGLDTLVHPDSAQEVDNDPVRDYEYEPVLRENVSGEVEELTTQGAIEQVGSSFNKVQWSGFGSPRDLLTSLQILLGIHSGSTSVALRVFTVTIPIGLVFFWWGLRKVIHMLFAAFRSGRMTVGGYDVNPNSYYFGTRAKDWR